MAKEQRDWHRLFGLILTDFFTGSPFRVELEKDLSLKKQLLDVVILRREAGPFSERLPDGFDDLAAHNLITFKSYQETLDDWTLKELTCHYEHYRQHSADTSSLLRRLVEQYQKEGVPMPYTMEDFRRDFTKEHLHELTPEDRLAGLPPEQRVAGLSPEQRLAGLSPEEIAALL